MNAKDYRIWSILIRRIESILEFDIDGDYKCVLIKYEIENERNRK